VVALAALGLEPSTRYHYAVEVDGALDLLRAGTFRTFAEGPQSLVIAFSSCTRTNSNGAVFDAIREARPDLYLALGDFHYSNIESNDRGRFRDALDRQLTATAQAALYRQVPIGYVWDDHDFAGNDSNAFSRSREAAQLTYREYVPHYATVAGDGDAPIHQAFTVGRVRVILTDGRSVRRLEELPGGAPSMLGAEQREWLLAELVEASRSHALVVWGNPQPWIAAASAGADNWGGYAAERRLIAEHIAAEGIENLVMLSGDAHMLAIDDGANTGFAEGGGGGFPVMHAAALDRPGSTKGGPYSEGAIPGAGQFGLMTITDDGGDTIEITWSGRDWSDEELIAHSFTVAVPPGARVAVAPAP
jgi:phosphodiesterase/alkaline phosphatase D-like protein